jgi:inosine/xanthosine triphosphate pyrophosphatase family protein
VGDRGFGYDPVFFYPPMGKRFSQLTLDEKNRISHRGLALQHARFRCVIAVAWSPEEIQTVEGAAEGLIAEEAVGDRGFGYDPVFYYPPMGRYFAEMTLDEKNRISHRGLALQEARAVIIDRLNSSRSQ